MFIISIIEFSSFIYFRDIQSFVSKQFLNIKSYVYSNNGAKALDESFGPGKQPSALIDSDLESLGSFDKLLKNEGRRNEKIICSSPTSSIPSSSGVNSSWEKISRISSSSKKSVKRSSPKVLVLSPPKTSVKESDNEVVLGENCNSFPSTKPENKEFKSFLIESLSETDNSPSYEVNLTDTKSCQDLKNQLQDFFDKMKRETRRGLEVSLPSPPNHFSDMSEPGGMSQCSEVSDVESYPFLSCTDIETKKK